MADTPPHALICKGSGKLKSVVADTPPHTLISQDAVVDTYACMVSQGLQGSRPCAALARTGAVDSRAHLPQHL